MSRLIGAVEAGGTKFVLALADERGAIRSHARIPTETADTTFRAMVDFFRTAEGTHGKIDAFGIGSFGPLSIDRAAHDWGRITTTPKPGWRGASYPLAFASFGVPVGIDTDVNAAALGEWLTGAGRGMATLAYVTVGTGVGVGVLHDGKPLAGITHFEGGHIRPQRMPDDSFPGVCPTHADCVEGLVAGPAIKARWGVSLDRLGSQETGLVARYLAELATTLVLLHMPERLIFGGGVSKSPGLIEAIRHVTETRLAGYVSHPALDPGLEQYIVAPGLGDDAGIRGAIELGRRVLPPWAE